MNTKIELNSDTGSAGRVKNTIILSESQCERLNFVKEAFFNSFNATSLTPEQVANKFYSKDLKFYAGDTGKIINFKDMIGRIKAVRRDFKSAYFVYTDTNFSSTGSSVAETHCAFNIKNDDSVIIIQTSNICCFDKDGKIARIYNVEQVLSKNIDEGVHGSYMTE